MRIYIHYIALSILVLSLPLSNCVASNLELWCSKTPYPQPCLYFMVRKSQSSSMKHKFEFKKMTLQIALEQAFKLQAQSKKWCHGSKIVTSNEKAAWSDCRELYQDSIFRLNNTNTHYAQITEDDIQTWLTSAITNLETCHAGFVELGVHRSVTPTMNILPELIINALAVNQNGLHHRPEEENELPVIHHGFNQQVLESSNPTSVANIVVAQDGSGNFSTIQEAVNFASKREGSGSDKFVVYVKEGSYSENVEIGREGKNIFMVGDGIGKTIITGNRSLHSGFSTFNSATIAISGDGFIAREITFRNTAGPSGGQAVAVRSGSDFSVFYRCGIEGYQDTLYVHSSRQFFRECNIYGTIDFIFGNAAVVFQNCSIYVRDSFHKTSTITAQGRSNPSQKSGIVIQNSKVTSMSEESNEKSSMKTYLGRPLGNYSQTVFIKTFLDDLIDPSGWANWGDDSVLNTLYYGEYDNEGPGSSTASRVKWDGYHVITNSTDALKYSLSNFIDGDSWLPSLNVPFRPGL